jgi:hypothetical protein
MVRVYDEQLWTALRMRLAEQGETAAKVGDRLVLAYLAVEGAPVRSRATVEQRLARAKSLQSSERPEDSVPRRTRARSPAQPSPIAEAGSLGPKVPASGLELCRRTTCKAPRSLHPTLTCRVFLPPLLSA